MENASKSDLYAEDEILILGFDDGECFEVGVMGLFDLDGKTYIALESLDDSVDDVYLYEYISCDDDFELVDIPDDKFDAVEDAFEKIMNS